MTSDLHALLAAIVADPVDDTARLAYADCLEEHGNAARAQFIRLQIEAERLHPNSNARARLEEKAHAILAEHWIEWWGEVCAGVGLQMPVLKPRGALGRLVRRFGKPTGHPYSLVPHQSEIVQRQLERDPVLGAWEGTTFRRGWPGSIRADLEKANPSLGFLQRWTTVSPLDALHLTASHFELWHDDRSLSNLQSLTLRGYHPSALRSALASPRLGKLRELRLEVWQNDADYDSQFADELSQALRLPRCRELRRLGIPLWTDRMVEVVANADNLATLEALEVAVLRPFEPSMEDGLTDEDFAGQARRLAILARSPYLAGLRELKVGGYLDTAGLEAVVRNPTWRGLRKLEVQVKFWPARIDSSAGTVDLSELEELRLFVENFDAAQVAALVQSRLLKQLRHFAVYAMPGCKAVAELADAVDLERIETFAIDRWATTVDDVARLDKRLGDRLREL